MIKEEAAQKREAQYQKLLALKSKAKTEKDFLWLADAFTEDACYKDADKLVDECKQKAKKQNNLKALWGILMIVGAAVYLASAITFIVLFVRSNMGGWGTFLWSASMFAAAAVIFFVAIDAQHWMRIVLPSGITALGMLLVFLFNTPSWQGSGLTAFIAFMGLLASGIAFSFGFAQPSGYSKGFLPEDK